MIQTFTLLSVVLHKITQAHNSNGRITFALPWPHLREARRRGPAAWSTYLDCRRSPGPASKHEQARNDSTTAIANCLKESAKVQEYAHSLHTELTGTPILSIILSLSILLLPPTNGQTRNERGWKHQKRKATATVNPRYDQQRSKTNSQCIT